MQAYLAGLALGTVAVAASFYILYAPVNLSIYLSIHITIYLSIQAHLAGLALGTVVVAASFYILYGPVYLSIYPYNYLSIYLYNYLSIYITIYLSMQAHLAGLALGTVVVAASFYKLYAPVNLYIYLYNYLCSPFSYRSSNFAIAKLSLLIPLLQFLYKFCRLVHGFFSVLLPI